MSCSENDKLSNIPVVNDGALVISPDVTIDDAVNFEVESSYIGMSDLPNKRIQGILKIKYTGTVALRSVVVTLSFLNKDNIVLFKGAGNISNIISCYSSEISSNTNSFLSSEYETGYLFIGGTLSYFGLSALEDISKIQISIAGIPFTYQAARGKFSITGNPYIGKDNKWVVNAVANGDKKIGVYVSRVRFLFEDSQNRLYRWGVPDNYELTSYGEERYYNFNIGETVYFTSNVVKEFNNKNPFNCVDVCLQWY